MLIQVSTTRLLFLNGVNIHFSPIKPVTIDNINCGNPSLGTDVTQTEDFCNTLFVDNTGNAADTQFDGYTKPLYERASSDW
jgi:hypothetical protein